MIKIVLKTKTPPSKKNSKRITRNKYSGKTIVRSSEAHENWHEEMMWNIRKYRPEKPYENVRLELYIWAHDRARNDNTNKAESIHDLLVDSLILKDDSWYEMPETYQKFMGVDKENPRVEIVIIPL